MDTGFEVGGGGRGSETHPVYQVVSNSTDKPKKKINNLVLGKLGLWGGAYTPYAPLTPLVHPLFHSP